MQEEWGALTLILYHGSNVHIENIELQRCRPYKDFGRGFYCTTIKSQAELMAKRVAAIYGGNPAVTQFEMNEGVHNDDSINVKKFERATRDWALFVLNNRDKHFKQIKSLDCNHDNKYDVVIGPVANDDLALLFRTFSKGMIDLDALVKGLEYKKLNDQYSFHTDKALQYLKPLGGI
jgi:hypothetical protein